MADMKIGVVGAAGRMGGAVIRQVTETDGCAVVAACETHGSPAVGRDAGDLAAIGPIGVTVVDDPAALFQTADAVVEFSIPAATIAHTGLAAAAGCIHVIGTTGFSDADLSQLKAAARHAVIVKSGNMSLGINLLGALVREAAKALPNYDIEIVEMHHRMKVDAPSGTALLLGEAAAEGREISLRDHSVRARDGQTGARPDGAIGFASLRGGTVVGDHKVVLAGPHERIELTHRAEDRMIFARGAIAAALWGQGKKPGIYSMKDVLGI